jgi:hypothetical protein
MSEREVLATHGVGVARVSTEAGRKWVTVMFEEPPPVVGMVGHAPVAASLVFELPELQALIDALEDAFDEAAGRSIG